MKHGLHEYPCIKYYISLLFTSAMFIKFINQKCAPYKEDMIKDMCRIR